MPPTEYGISEWDQKRNEHAREATAEWDQCGGEAPDGTQVTDDAKQVHDYYITEH